MVSKTLRSADEMLRLANETYAKKEEKAEGEEKPAKEDATDKPKTEGVGFSIPQKSLINNKLVGYVIWTCPSLKHS